MSTSAPTLNDLISLNQEIASLVKAGIPLELGLRGLAAGTGSRSRLGHLADRLSDRLAEGQTLPDALTSEGPAISPVYTAVIKAGLASGKLPEALESLAASGLLIQETRRRVFLASLYPVICVFVAYSLFCGFLVFVAQRLITTVEDFTKVWPVGLLQNLLQYRNIVTTIIPVTVIGLTVLVFAFRHTLTRHVWQFLTSFRWVTGRSLNWAQFTELLALQVEQRAPLAGAIVLAADSTDDLYWQREAREVAADLKRGATLQEALRFAHSLPPLVRWMLATGEKQGTLAMTLRQLTDMYRRQALRRAAIVKVWLPVSMTVFFTSAIGLTYGLAFILPLRAFLMGLMQE